MSPTLIGRDEELSALVGALHEARQGQPTLVLLSGEAGIGKTRLLEEFLTRAQASGCRTLGGACLDISAGDLPFLPFRRMLRTLRGEIGDDGLRDLLGPSASDIALLLPNAVLAEGSTVARAAGDSPVHVFELVLQLVDGLADSQPLVVTVEDAHWADRSTLHALAYVLHGLVDRPVLVLVTHRNEDLPDDVEWQGTFTGLVRYRHSHHVALRGLPHELTARLVRSIRPDATDAVVEYAQTWSGGVPLFVEEIVVSAGAGRVTDIPHRIADAVRLRLSGLPDDSRQLVACVAAIGRDVEHSVVAAACGLAPDRLSSAVRAAVDRRVLVYRPPTTYGFRHALTREVAYELLLPSERQVIHAAIATALERDAHRRGSTDVVVLGELAYHWSLADDDHRALTTTVAAARAAARAYAYPESVRLYQHGIELRGRVVMADGERFEGETVSLFDLLSEAAEVAHWAGRNDLTQGLLARALSIADESSDERVVRRLLLDMNSELWAARVERDQANVWIERWGDAATRAAVGSGNLMVQGDYSGSAELARDALELARRAGMTAQEIKAGYLLGLDLVLLGDTDAGLQQLDIALGLARDVGDRDRLVAAYVNKAFALEHDGRWQDALTTSLTGIDEARSLGAEASDAVLLWSNAASELIRLGRLGEAEALLAEAFERRPAAGVEVMLVIYGVEVATARGDFQEANRRLARLPARTNADDYQTVGQLAAVQAELLLWTHRPDDALGVLDEALSALGDDDPQLIARLVWLRLRAAADRIAQRPPHDGGQRIADLAVAQDFLDRVNRLAARPASRGAAAEIAAYQRLDEAEHARLSAPTEDGPWRIAGEVWAGTPSVLAYCLVQEATALGVGGQRRLAGARLRAAREIASHHGLGAILGSVDGLSAAFRLRTDLASPQQPPATAQPVVPFNLTARESQVLQLLAEGLSNRRIARALSVPGRTMSESTASVHVSRILAKLGVTSRTEAAALAHRSGLVAPTAQDTS
ncbi:MAG: AAA family ATPase [Candidatus Nanopelagicales bacterium]